MNVCRSGETSWWREKIRQGGHSKLGLAATRLKLGPTLSNVEECFRVMVVRTT